MDPERLIKAVGLERVEPDYEAAARAYRHVDEPHVMAHVCKVVDAAIGDRFLINPPTEEE